MYAFFKSNGNTIVLVLGFGRLSRRLMVLDGTFHKTYVLFFCHKWKRSRAEREE